MKKLIIECFLVKESNKKRNDEIIKEISKAFSKEEILIPWYDKIAAIRLE
jgi:hypothetical protein